MSWFKSFLLKKKSQGNPSFPRVKLGEANCTFNFVAEEMTPAADVKDISSWPV